MKIRKNIQSINQKNALNKHVHLLLTGEEGKRHCALVKDFNTFTYDHTLNRGLRTALKLMVNK